MEFFVGLDVSVKTTSICVMDAAGTIIREGKAESSLEAISAFLAAADRHYVRVGLEAGPLCQWLYAGLTKAGFPVICIETRHAQAVLSARPNKTDRNDARGIAQMMRVGLYLPVHVKTLASQDQGAAERPALPSVQAARCREQHSRPAAQLRPQGRRRVTGSVRAAHPRTDRRPAILVGDH